MKRAFVISLGILLLIFLVSVFVVLRSLRSDAPRFTKAQIPTSIKQVNYDFLSPRPFERGKMWIGAWSGGTNGAGFVYNLDTQQVLGQLTNGWPEMLFGDPP